MRHLVLALMLLAGCHGETVWDCWERCIDQRDACTQRCLDADCEAACNAGNEGSCARACPEGALR